MIHNLQLINYETKEKEKEREIKSDDCDNCKRI